MINAKNSLSCNLNSKNELSGTANKAIKYVEPITQEKEITPSETTQEIIPDKGYTGLSKVTVKSIPKEYVKPDGTLEITENGSYDVKKYETLTTNIHEPEPYKPRFISFNSYKGDSLNEEISNLDTSLITDMRYMFQDCRNLVKLDLGNFNTSNVTIMYYMFSNCLNLLELTINSFDTSKVTGMDYMFRTCEKLQKLDIRSFTFDKVTSYYAMFNGVPNDCLIIVKSDTEKEWITSKWTNLTNVKTVDEL